MPGLFLFAGVHSGYDAAPLGSGRLETVLQPWNYPGISRGFCSRPNLGKLPWSPRVSGWGLWTRTAMDKFYDAEHWRARAAEARSIAEGMKDPVAQRAMLNIASGYDHLADRAESRRRSASEDGGQPEQL